MVARPVTLLPLGAVEVHGPHLPLETDTVIASELAWRAAARLNSGGAWAAGVAEPFTRTAASYAAGIAGTVDVPREEENRLLEEAITSLRARGADRIVLVNLHFDPEHMKALVDFMAGLKGRGERAILFPNFTRRACAQRIGGEFATGSCHAGEFETSLMLAAAPELVKPTYRDLPDLFVDLPSAIRQGKRSFREIGMERAYCGAPSRATKEEGERLFRVLAGIVVEECLEASAGGPDSRGENRQKR